MLWLFAWLPPMVFAAGSLSVHVRPYQLLPLLIPIVVILVQIVYPTMPGWAVIAIPSGFFAGVVVFFVVVTVPGRDPRYEPQGLVISSVAAAVYVLVCVALWFARPKHRGCGCCPTNPCSL